MKNPKVSNVSGTKAKTAVFQYSSVHSLQEKYCKTIITMESVHSEGMPFGGHDSPGVKNPKMGNIKLMKNLALSD